MPQIKENKHVVSRPWLILNDMRSGISQARQNVYFEWII